MYMRENFLSVGRGVEWGHLLSKAPTDSGRKVRKKKEKDGVPPSRITPLPLLDSGFVLSMEE